MDPWLRLMPLSLKQTYLLAFAARFCTGIFWKAIQVGFQSVEKALHHISQALVLAGYDNPRWTYGSKELDLPFWPLLKGYKDQDPAPKPQLAIPVATVEQASAYHLAPNAAHVRVTADLISVAFFFLLRVGKYTMLSNKVRTRTIQF
jgi:hypothetical protein